MAEDRFDIEEFLEENESKIQDYDSYLELLEPEFVSGTFGGGFGLYSPVKVDHTPEEQWEIIKSVIINQGNVEAFQEYFNQLSDEDTFNKLSELIGYNMNPELIDAIEIAAPAERDKFISYIVTNETTAAAQIFDNAPGSEELKKILGIENFEDITESQKADFLQIINASMNIPGSAALAQYYGYDNQSAVFNFDYEGTSTNVGPVYKMGMAEGLLASMSENEVADMQSLLIRAGYLSPFSAYTLFDPSDPATQVALGKAMAAHNNRKDGAPQLNLAQQQEILSGLISPELTNVVLDKLNFELNQDVKQLDKEEKTRLYATNELTLAAATERADTIAGGVLQRDVDMVTAGRLAKVYQDIYNEKYQQVVETALDKMSTGRRAELQRIRDVQAGKDVEDTRFVGVPASSETESLIPSTEELGQQAATFAKLDFARKLKDTYFAQEIDDNERRSAITQSAIGFNTALRTLSG